MMISVHEQENRKLRIIHTAFQLFCEHGIDEVSIAQIARGAGVGHASVFRYFTTKGELILCTQRLLWEEVVAHICAGNATKLTPEMSGLAELEVLLLGFQTLYEEHACYLLFAADYKLFLVRHHARLPLMQYHELLRPVRNAFEPALKRGQADGSIRKKESIDTLFSMLWCVMRGFVDEIILYNKVYAGENPWSDHFMLLVKSVLALLKAGD